MGLLQDPHAAACASYLSSMLRFGAVPEHHVANVTKLVNAYSEARDQDNQSLTDFDSMTAETVGKEMAV